jgi:hypothetical protein
MSLNEAKRREGSTRGTAAAEKTNHANSKRSQEGKTSLKNRMIISLTDTTKEILTIGRVVGARLMIEGRDIEVTIATKRFIKKERSLYANPTEKKNYATKLDKKKPTSKNMSLILSAETPVSIITISPTTILKEREKKNLAGKMLNRGNLLKIVAETLKGSQALHRS